MRLAAVLLLAPAISAAQSLEPRAYSNLPVGLNVLLVGYSRSQGGVGFDPSVPLENGRMRAHVIPLGYVRSLDVMGNAGSFALLLPLVDLAGAATLGGASEVQREVSGLGDPSVRLAVNFHGAPALRAAEFAAWRQDLIVGASLAVTAPFGQYDKDRLLNIGTNRWSVKPELGLSQALGPWTVELATGVTWFSRNEDFFQGSTRSQEPLYSAQAHLTRQLGRGIWGAFSATYYRGGRTSIDGAERDDRLSSTRLGLTLSLPVDRRNSLKLAASAGVYARSGSDSDTIGIIWQHLWGETQ
jgi:hypothetical protein